MSGFLMTAKNRAAKKKTCKWQTDLMIDMIGSFSFVFILIGQYVFILIGQRNNYAAFLNTLENRSKSCLLHKSNQVFC